MSFFKSKAFKYLFILILVVVLAVIFQSGLIDNLTFENLNQNQERLSEFVTENYFLTLVSYIGIYVLSVAFSLPGATILTITGGFLFGFLAVLYVNLAATLGATLVFLFARYFLRESVQKRYSDNLEKLNKDIDKNGANYLLTLRFIPVFPFFLINLLAGLTKIKLWTFVWTTSIGILPGSFVFVFAGTQLSEVDSVEEILSPGIIIALVLLGLLSFSPTIIKRFKSTKPG